MLGGLFVKGALIGFSIAAPVGPIGVLCIRRSLAEGRASGLATGLGAATADAFYGSIAAFGLTALSSFLLMHRISLALCGGLFLCYLGVRAFVSEPSPLGGRGESRHSLASAYLSTCVLTLSNPATILSFLAIFAGMAFDSGMNFAGSALLVCGVFLGSATWWLLLSHGVSLFRARVDAGWMRVINRASGVVIAGFGVYALSTVLGG